LVQVSLIRHLRVYLAKGDRVIGLHRQAWQGISQTTSKCASLWSYRHISCSSGSFASLSFLFQLHLPSLGELPVPAQQHILTSQPILPHSLGSMRHFPFGWLST